MRTARNNLSPDTAAPPEITYVRFVLRGRKSDFFRQHFHTKNHQKNENQNILARMKRIPRFCNHHTKKFTYGQWRDRTIPASETKYKAPKWTKIRKILCAGIGVTRASRHRSACSLASAPVDTLHYFSRRRGGKTRDFATRTPRLVPRARRKGSWKSDRRRREKSARDFGLPGRGILGDNACRQLCRTVWASAAAKTLFHVKNDMAILVVLTPEKAPK